MSGTNTLLASIENIRKAGERLKGIATQTPLMRNHNLSTLYQANIYLKREDLQLVRSYKLRGAYNMIAQLPDAKAGIVCASAGNHAQGVAYSCQKLGIRGTIFMPTTTPKQKINQVRMFGKEFVTVRLTGDTFDDSYEEAVRYCDEHKLSFIHPFDHEMIIEGQATVGLEILEDLKEHIDYLIVPIGGGGLVSGLISIFNVMSPSTKVIGVEPLGAPAMETSLRLGKNTTLETIDKFVDGAAVKHVGDIPFAICQEYLDRVVLVPEGKVCSTIIKLYNEEAIVVEPAGSLSIAALDFIGEELKGKNVVCVVSGSNNDLGRMNEIRERSLMYEGLMHYFIVNFPQRAGALREFLDEVLGPNDDITRFEYTKKNMKEYGPALVGIELKSREDYASLIERMEKKGVVYTTINKDPNLFNYFL